MDLILYSAPLFTAREGFIRGPLSAKRKGFCKKFKHRNDDWHHKTIDNNVVIHAIRDQQ